MSSKICPGMVCSLDPYNTLKQRETEISHVVIIKRHKYRPFGNSSWEVMNADSPITNDSSESFYVNEHLLKPENVTCLRIPADIPDFNDLDLDALKYAYKIMSGEFLAMPTDEHRKKVDRIKAIYEKIKFCKELRDV